MFTPATQQRLAAQPNVRAANGISAMPAPLDYMSADWMNTAATGTQNAMNYNPQMVTSANPHLNHVRNTLTDGRTFNEGQIASTNMQPYMNKYDRNVINRATNDLNRGREMVQNDIGAQATAAGAFGGSRHGLVEAENNRNFANAVGDMSAQQRQAGFLNAQNMAQQDINNQFTGQGMRNDAAQTLGGLNLAATGMNNANRQFNANQRNMANQMQLSGANQLNNMSGDAFNRSQAINSDLSRSGAMQQQLQQSLFNAMRGQWGGYTGSPQNALNTVTQSIGASPGNNAGSQTQSQSRDLGIMDFLPLLFLA